MTRRLSWIVLSLVAVLALAVGATGDRTPRTESERIQALAGEVRCPTCQNLSAAESTAKAAQAVRDEIRTRVRRGESNDQIRAFLASRYTEEIILKPETRGVTGLVWVIPILGGVAVLAGLVVTFRRWKRESLADVSDADRARVEAAMQP